MARDVNLVLDSGQTLIASANTTAIDTEGGGYANIRLFLGAMSGASTTFDTVVQASVDGGSNYYSVGAFPQLGPTDDSIEIARPVYIPRPDSGQTVTKVRLAYTLAGASPSYAVTKAFLEPMVGAAPPALDEELTIGVALLT